MADGSGRDDEHRGRYRLHRAGGPGPLEASRAEQAMRDEGLDPRGWGNGPGDTYGWHDHPYDKTLVCLAGSIVFHTDAGDVELFPGDRLELWAGTRHAATVGPGGVRCVEAARPPPPPDDDGPPSGAAP